MQPSIIEPAKYIPPAPKREVPVKLIVIIVSTLLIIAAGVVVALVLLNSGKKGEGALKVQQVITAAAVQMETVAATGDGYPTVIPGEANNEVLLTGGGSFDGTTYCITAKLANDERVTYYMTPDSSAPREGSCATATDLGKPGVVTNSSLSLLGASQVKFTWNRVANAAKYIMQCATDTEFTTVKQSVESTETFAMCDELDDDTVYYVRIRAENTHQGEWSAVREIRTSALPPSTQ
jgi:type II secretory pathway pseudopilin PulG